MTLYLCMDGTVRSMKEIKNLLDQGIKISIVRRYPYKRRISNKCFASGIWFPKKFTGSTQWCEN